jgi:hypothetical protein
MSTAISVGPWLLGAVGEKTCVHGPEFDAHKVDFEELTRRTRAYLDQERQSREAHACQIGLGQ